MWFTHRRLSRIFFTIEIVSSAAVGSTFLSDRLIWLEWSILRQAQLTHTNGTAMDVHFYCQCYCVSVTWSFDIVPQPLLVTRKDLVTLSFKLSGKSKVFRKMRFVFDTTPIQRTKQLCCVQICPIFCIVA